jgi:hypothetical protein
VQVTLAPADLEPLIDSIIERVVARLESERSAMADRIAFSEAEAAALLGIEDHVLRDERQRGGIVASRIVGRRIRYQRADLLAYLTERRIEGGRP